MPLASGDHLGNFEILAKIGAGGMGEVYKARDTRLDRVVALKTSKQQFTERFDREARAVAQLNHPNICTLHDVGPNFLVMEFVEGAPLKGPLPIDEVLRIAHQITAALEAAHEKHITHRDLKPANVMLKPDGSIKVLDFGLAKLAPPPRTDLSPEYSPTLTMSLTDAGMVVGTAACMAPEQAKGSDVDKRADIWSFGVVLYELLSGKRPFQGNDIAEILASVIKEQPDYEKVPHEFRRLIKKCLEKDPAKRLRDIGDAWELLETPPVPAPAPPAAKSNKRWPAAAAVFAILAIAAGFLYLRQPPPTDPPSRLLAIEMPDAISGLALSPDGTMLAAGSAAGINVRRFDSDEVRLLPDTDGATYFFTWSPDSRSIIFRAAGPRLMRTDVNNGPPVLVTNISPDYYGAAWRDDGVLLIGPAKGILRTSVNGDTPTPVTIAGKQYSSHQNPVLLPDGHHFFYNAVIGLGNGDLLVGDLNTPPAQQSMQPLISGSVGGPESRVFFIPADPARPEQGHLIFRRGSTLLAQPFDADARKLSGEPTALSSQTVRQQTVIGDTAVFSTLGGQKSQLTWFDRTGKPTSATVGEPAFQFATSLSPYGKHIAVERTPDLRPGGANIWVLDVASNTSTKISGQGQMPIWSPDGTELIFAGYSSNGRNLVRVPANGAVEPKLVYQPAGNGIVTPQSWIGSTLLLEEGGDLYTLDLNGRDAKPQLYLALAGNQYTAQFSPDGRWVAYSSNDSGTTEVYVSSYPDPRISRVTVSSGDGLRPRWSRDGRLLYLTPDNTLVSVAVNTGSTFTLGTRTTLGNVHARSGSNARGNIWDITPDGRILVNSGADGTDTPALSILLNWRSLLRK